MPKPNFTINALDIAGANLGWMVAQMLLGTMVTKKIMTASEAKTILDGCLSHYQTGSPDRSVIREAVKQGLGPLIKQYDVPSPSQQH